MLVNGSIALLHKSQHEEQNGIDTNLQGCGATCCKQHIDRKLKIVMDEVANRLLMISTIGVPMCLSHPPSSCKILYNEATEESGDLIVRKMAPIKPLFCDFGD